MQRWQIMDNRKSPQITYQCSGCGCMRTMDTIEEHLPRECPNCRENMSISNYPFFHHRIAKENANGNKG